VRERKALWPYWLILALVSNLLEVALRKDFRAPGIVDAGTFAVSMAPQPA